jgi:multiple antibiotic resistance protein
MNDITHIFTILFLMLGPFKIIVPYAKLTEDADKVLARKIAIRAIVYSSLALLMAATIGEKILTNYGIPVPILAMTGGIVLFLVALINVVQQFGWQKPHEHQKEEPSLKMAMYPLAFPTIVTPYGIAAVIVFMALMPDMKGRLLIGALVVGIMVVNLVFMLVNRYIFRFLALVLPVLAAVLGVVQVALGLWIMYRSFTQLPKISMP